MHATRKVKLKDLTPNLTCNLCHGYFVDATTIIECLHSFCRSCIIQHLEKSEYCPVCDVHCSSKPLTSIRSDQMLQEIVYKLVPGLFQSEMTKRRKFYKQNPTLLPTNQHDAGHTNESYITSDDIIQLSLEYYTTDAKFRESTKRYVKCPAAVSIGILKKLIHGKYDLNNFVQIDVMYGDRILPEDFLLMDIAYKYSWTQNGNKPLELAYRVKGLVTVADKQPPVSRQKLKPMPKISKKVNGGVNARAKNSVAAKRKLQKNLTSVMTPVNSNGPPVIKRRSSKADAITVIPKVPTKFKLPPKGERKRKLSREIEMELIIESNNNDDKSPIKKHARYEPNNNEHEMMITNESGTEVQLRISENGVISATSIVSTPNYDRIGSKNGEEKVILNVPKKPLKSCLKSGLNNPNEKTSRSNNASEQGQLGKGNQKGLVNGSHEISKKMKPGRKSLKIEKISNGMSEAIANAKLLKGKKQNLGVGQQQQPKLKKIPVPGPGAIRLSMAGGSPNEKGYTNGHQTSNKLLQQLQSPKKSSAGVNANAAAAAVMKRFHTSRQNGNLKFTPNSSPLKCTSTTKANSTSPIRLPQNVNGVEIIPIGAPNLSPSKKPPKFFKSRASITELPAPTSTLTPNGDHRPDFANAKSTTTSPSSAVTDTITNSSTSLFSTLNLLQNSNSAGTGTGNQACTKNSLSPNANTTAGANTIETTATTSVMVPIPMSSSYNSSQMYRFPTGAATTTTLPWTANTCTSSMLMNQNVPLNHPHPINLMPYNLMPYYSNMQNSALQLTAAAIQQQLHLQQMQLQQRNSLAAQLISGYTSNSGTGSPGLNHNHSHSVNANNDNNNTLDLSPTSRKQQHGVNGDDETHAKKISRHQQEQIDAHNKSPAKKAKLSGSENGKMNDSTGKNNSSAPKRSKKTNGMSPSSHRSPKHISIAPAITPAVTANMATILQIPNLLMVPEVASPSPKIAKAAQGSSPSESVSTRQSFPNVPRATEINLPGSDSNTESSDAAKKQVERLSAKSAASSRLDGDNPKLSEPGHSADHGSTADKDAPLPLPLSHADAEAETRRTNIKSCSEGHEASNPTATAAAIINELSRNENSCSPALVIAEQEDAEADEDKTEKIEGALALAVSEDKILCGGSKQSTATPSTCTDTAEGGHERHEVSNQIEADSQSESSPASVNIAAADADADKQKQAPTPEPTGSQTELKV